MGLGLGALGGLAKGIAQGTQMAWDQQERERQAARQEKIDAMTEEKFGREKKEWADKDAIERATTDIMSAGTQTPGFASESSSGKYFNRDQNEAQQLADLNAAADEMAAGPAGDQGASQPLQASVKQAASVAGLDGKSKLFTGLNAATEAKQYVDNGDFGSYAKYTTLRDKLATMPGGQEYADKFFQRMKLMKEEGLDKALSYLDADRPEDAMRAAQSVGQYRPPEGSKLVSRQGKHWLTGADDKVWSLVDKDGKVIQDDVRRSIEGGLLGFKDRATIAATLKKSEDSAEARRYAAEMAFQRGLMLGGGGGRSGGSGGSGGSGKQPSDPAMSLLEDAYKADAPGGGKHTGAQLIEGTAMLDVIPKTLPNGTTLSDKMRAQIAYDASVNPNSTTTQINPTTGQIERVYKMAPRPNAAGNMIPASIPVGVWSVDQAVSAASTDDDASKKVRATLGAEVQKITSGLPRNEQQNVIDSAFSERARREYMGRYQGEIARSVQDLDKPQEWKDAYVKQNVQARERLIDLQREFGKKPEWVEKQESQARVKAGLAATANSNYTESQAASVKKWFGDEKPIIPSITNAAKGLYNSAAESFKQSNVRSEDYIRKTVADINKTGRIWPADASAIAATLKSKPELKSLFTPDQLEAIQARTGAQF
jgi:hypothetical protein